jgi:hypothetical protein
MTDKQREEAISEGKIRLPTPKEFRKMKKEELNELRAKFKPYIEEMKEDALAVFRSFPKGLMLVTR